MITDTTFRASATGGAYTPHVDPDDGVIGTIGDDQGSPTPGVLPRKPFPVAALPAIVRDAVTEWSDALGVPAELYALPALAALGAAVGTTRSVWYGTKTHYPAVWAAPICESGGFKSDGVKKAFAPIWRIEREARERFAEAAREAEQGDNAPHEEAEPHFLLDDTTIEAVASVLQTSPRGVGVASDELSGFLGSFGRYNGGSGDAARWLSLFEGGTLKVTRKSSGTIFVDRALVSLSGSIQPGAFRKCMGEHGGANVDNGMLARFLLAWPAKVAPPMQANPPTFRHDGAYRELLETLCGAVADPDAEPYTFAGEAEREIDSWVNGPIRERIESASGALAGGLSKLRPGYAVRLALLDAACEDPAQRHARLIPVESVRRAVALCDWFAYELERILLDFRDTGAELATTAELEGGDTRSILDYISKQEKGATANTMQKNRRTRYPTNTDMTNRLNGLVDQGLLERRKVTPKGGGRAHHRYFHRLP